MTGTEIKFTDAAGYDDYMGPWSRSVGDQFLDWLALGKGLRWLDVGCGSGAFTERIVARCEARSVNGVDPARDQIDFAQSRKELRTVNFKIGDAMDLPYQNNTFDVAVMPLVVFFVPDPFKGVAEMARVVTKGGTVAAYGWDLTGGGFPYEAVKSAMEAEGFVVRTPPSPDAAEFDRLRAFWSAAKLESVETKKIPVERTFASVEEFWVTVMKGPNLGPTLAEMKPPQLAAVKARVNAQLEPDAAGRLLCRGWAHAVRGRVAR